MPKTAPSQPPRDARAFKITARNLGALRRFVARSAAAFGLDDTRVDELVVATNEVATNSVVHGGGNGELKMWAAPSAVTCEIRDEGWIRDSVSRRPAPATTAADGRGLWIAKKLCDRVEIRSTRAGSSVRLHMSRG